MKVRPLHSFRLLGTSMEVDEALVYDAVWATNQPDWEARSKVFLLCDWKGKPAATPQSSDRVGFANTGDCYSMLLEEGEYEIA